jgi:hypothetical protein
MNIDIDNILIFGFGFVAGNLFLLVLNAIFNKAFETTKEIDIEKIPPELLSKLEGCIREIEELSKLEDYIKEMER